MKRSVAVAVLAALVVSCGGDPIEAAENCSELSRAVDAEIKAIGDNRDRIDQLGEKTLAKAQELGEAAIARGAELEAAICADAVIAVGAAAVEDVFTEISNALTPSD